jgi:hypothetical protein
MEQKFPEVKGPVSMTGGHGFHVAIFGWRVKSVQKPASHKISRLSPGKRRYISEGNKLIQALINIA